MRRCAPLHMLIGGPRIRQVPIVHVAIGPRQRSLNVFLRQIAVRCDHRRRRSSLLIAARLQLVQHVTQLRVLRWRARCARMRGLILRRRGRLSRRRRALRQDVSLVPLPACSARRSAPATSASPKRSTLLRSTPPPPRPPQSASSKTCLRPAFFRIRPGELWLSRRAHSRRAPEHPRRRPRRILSCCQSSRRVATSRRPQHPQQRLLVSRKSGVAFQPTSTPTPAIPPPWVRAAISPALLPSASQAPPCSTIFPCWTPSQSCAEAAASRWPASPAFTRIAAAAPRNASYSFNPSTAQWIRRAHYRSPVTTSAKLAATNPALSAPVTPPDARIVSSTSPRSGPLLFDHRQSCRLPPADHSRTVKTPGRGPPSAITALGPDADACAPVSPGTRSLSSLLIRLCRARPFSAPAARGVILLHLPGGGGIFSSHGKRSQRLLL